MWALTYKLIPKTSASPARVERNAATVRAGKNERVMPHMLRRPRARDSQRLMPVIGIPHNNRTEVKNSIKAKKRINAIPRIKE